MDKKQRTTAAGRPVGDNQHALTVGPRGPIVFEDFLLFEKMAHDRHPEHYCADVEQAAFDPKNIVPGMGDSPAKMLQARLIAYPDAHRYRIGVNDDALPVHKPQCPVYTYHRDGAMRFEGTFGSAPHYESNSFHGPIEYALYRERPRTITGAVDRHEHRADSDDDTQPGHLFRLLTPDARERLIGNIVASMQSVPRHIQERQIGHFYKADPEYGCRVAEGLSLRMEEVLHGEPVTAAR